MIKEIKEYLWKRKEVQLVKFQAEYDELSRDSDRCFWNEDRLAELAGKIAALKKELELKEKK